MKKVNFNQAISNMSLKRRRMREEQRNKVTASGNVLQETLQTAQQAEKFILSMLKRFEDQYNVFLSSPDNRTPAVSVKFEMAVDRTSIPEADLKQNSVGLELLKKSLRDEKDSTRVQVMYLRIDKRTELRPNHGLVARPGAAEELQGDTLVSLLYHAAAILLQPDANSPLEVTKHTDLEVASGKRKLVDDLITHLFCSGIQYQESANERQWQLEHKMQMSKMKEKAKEVNDLFENAANLKVSSN